MNLARKNKNNSEAINKSDLFDSFTLSEESGSQTKSF